MNTVKPFAWLMVVLTLFWGGGVMQLAVFFGDADARLLIASFVWWLLAALLSMSPVKKEIP